MDKTPKFKIRSRRKKKNDKKSHSSATPGRPVGVPAGGETPVKASEPSVDLHPCSQFMDSEPLISWGSPQVSPSYEIRSRDWRTTASTPLRAVPACRSLARTVGTPSQFLRGLMDFSEQLKFDRVSCPGVESGSSSATEAPLSVEVSGPVLADDAEKLSPPPSPRYRPCPEELERLKGDSLRALLDDADDDVILECSQEVEDIIRRQEEEEVTTPRARRKQQGKKAGRSPRAAVCGVQRMEGTPEKTREDVRKSPEPTPRRKGLRTSNKGASSVKKDPWGDSFDDAVRRMLEDDFPTTRELTPKGADPGSPGLKGETFQQIVRRMLDECRPVEPPTQPLQEYVSESDSDEHIRPEVDGKSIWATLFDGADDEDMVRCSQEVEDVVRSVVPEVRTASKKQSVGKASPRTRPGQDSPRGETFQEIVRRMLDECRPTTEAALSSRDDEGAEKRVVRLKTPRRGAAAKEAKRKSARGEEDARKDSRRKSPRLRAAAQTSNQPRRPEVLQYFRPEEEDDLAKVLDIVESQTVHGSPPRCTPEEILQKKLEAKRRLAKKKKLSLRPKR